MLTETKLSEAPNWLRLLMYAQVGMAAVAVAVSFLAASKLKPLLAQRDELNAQVASLGTQVNDLKSQLATYRAALNAAREGINEYHAGNYSDAVASYDSALKLDPSNAYLLDLKGYSLFKGKRLDEALTALHQSVQANPHYAWGYFDLARVYCAQHNFTDAKVAIDNALRIDSKLKRKMEMDGEFRMLCQPILAKR
jgi:tetratricopeptide (TPR) repeat protein